MSYTVPLTPGAVYHIYNRGNNRSIIFHEQRNYTHFLALYRKYLTGVVDTYAYCLLPNHYHLLVRIQPLSSDDNGRPVQPSRRFAHCFNAYTKAVNKAYGRSGGLFEGPFCRRPLKDDAHFTTLVRYIHHNPVQHELAERFETWPHSSYAALLGRGRTFLKRKSVIGAFGTREDFIEAHRHSGPEGLPPHLLFDATGTPDGAVVH